MRIGRRPRTHKKGREFAVAAGGVHKYLARSLIALLVLHVAAALEHRFINKDGVMDRMSLLPRRQATI